MKNANTTYNVSFHYSRQSYVLDKSFCMVLYRRKAHVRNLPIEKARRLLSEQFGLIFVEITAECGFDLRLIIIGIYSDSEQSGL